MEEIWGKRRSSSTSLSFSKFTKILTSLQLLPWSIRHAFFLPLYQMEERKGKVTGGE